MKRNENRTVPPAEVSRAGPSDQEPILDVRNLKTEFGTDDGIVRAVDDVSYTIGHGETHGFVGESGAGKTVTALSVMRLIDSPGRIVDGDILYRGKNLREATDEEVRRIRGNEIAMIFQDPMTALNPSYTVGTQITDTIREHTELTKSEARDRAVDLLGDVGIPDPSARIDEYPHQFSGGMRQRALIAMALSCDPSLIIADEPTTALDVTIEAEILDLLLDLQDEYQVSIQLITHNMGVIARLCDTVSVMYAGEIVEQGPIERIFESPRHPYTVGLLNAIPRIGDDRARLDTIAGTMPDLIETPSGCSFRDRCEYATEECARIEPELEATSGSNRHRTACIRHEEIDFEEATVMDGGRNTRAQRQPSTPKDVADSETLVEISNLKKYFTPENDSWYNRLFGERKYVHAVDDVSFSIEQGETVGLVGESGCGKTTLGRTVTRIYEPTAGTILFAGTDLTDRSRRAVRNDRGDFQMIFQDPFSSLNPRRKILDIVGRPLEIHDKVSSAEEKRDRVKELLDEVGLKPSHVDRYPHEFSGGQKQRIGIARALAVEPDFIVADEPVSALDVSVQAKILNLFMELQDKHNLTYLFIAHDLNVVQHVSDRIAVMYLGEIVEIGSTDALFAPPFHPYTEILLSSIPQPTVEERRQRLMPEGEPPSPIDPPGGCRFHTRCPYAMPECEQHSPQLEEYKNGTQIACHLFDNEFMRDQPNDPADVISQQRSRFQEY